MASSRGPLNSLLASPAAQWATVALGTGFAVVPDKMAELVRTVTSGDGTSQILSSNGNNSAMDSRNSPIIIHTGGGSDSNNNNGRGGGGSGGGTVLSTIVTYTACAGCVWITYTVLSNALPEYVGQLLPVTRKVFDRATKHLAESMFNVKDVLEKQIASLLQKQDDLGQKQDDTHRDVKDVQDDVKHVRVDVSAVADSVERCETGIETAQRLQSYTARGVKLLVQAVGTVLPRDGDHHIMKDLQDYIRDGELHRESSFRNEPDRITPPENECPRRQLSRQLTPPPQTMAQPEGNNSDELSNLMALIREGRIPVR